MKPKDPMQIALDEFWADCCYSWMWQYQPRIMIDSLCAFLGVK